MLFSCYGVLSCGEPCCGAPYFDEIWNGGFYYDVYPDDVCPGDVYSDGVSPRDACVYCGFYSYRGDLYPCSRLQIR